MAKIKLECSGEYEFRVHGGPRDGMLLNTSKNMILDYGLDFLVGNTGDYYAGDQAGYACHVGTGGTAPVATDTTLQGPTKKSTTTVQSRVPVSGTVVPYQNIPLNQYYYELQWTYRFAAEVSNINYAEVGVGKSVTSLFSRALIVNPGGEPTPISLLTGEQLDVTYKLRVNAPAVTDGTSAATSVCGTGSVTIAGTVYNYTVYLHDFIYVADGVNADWPGTLAGLNTSNQFYLGADASLTYPSPAAPTTSLRVSTGSKLAVGRRRVTTKLALNEATSGVGRVRFKSGRYPTCDFVIVFDKVIPKDATSTLEFDLDFEVVRA